MKRLYEWLCGHFVEPLLVVMLVMMVVMAVFALVKGSERMDQYAQACKEIGGTPAHDGRQMVCFK